MSNKLPYLHFKKVFFYGSEGGQNFVMSIGS